MTCRFITFEGIDGAGKSTQIAAVASLLTAHGKTVLVTREPGGTVLGERLRELILGGGQSLQPETEALLMFAARREHVARVIQPALDAGKIVLSDRFTDATFAYQGGGHAVAQSKLELLEAWVHDGLQPDLTFLFDLPVEVARSRLGQARSPDRFERESGQFFDRVRKAYLQRAAQFPRRIVVVDAEKSAVDIEKIVEKEVTIRCLI